MLHSSVSIGQAIEAWLENGDAEQWTLVLEALQVTVEATRQRVILRGILPSEVPKFITTGRTSACSFQSDKQGTPFWSVVQGLATGAPSWALQENAGRTDS